MQPNPKPNFSDEYNRYGLLLTWIIVAANMDADGDMVADMNTYMENDVTAYVDNNDMAAYMDDDVAANVDDDVATYVDDDVAAYVDDDHIVGQKFSPYNFN
jgi:hypothetical protein